MRQPNASGPLLTLCSGAPSAVQLLAKRAGDNWIIKDLVEQPFYRFLKHAYPLFDVGQVRPSAAAAHDVGRPPAGLAGAAGTRGQQPHLGRTQAEPKLLCLRSQRPLPRFCNPVLPPLNPRHPALQHLILYCLGGWSAVVWTGAMRQVRSSWLGCFLGGACVQSR